MTLPTQPYFSHLYTIFCFLRGEESLLRLPLAIPRALLTLYNQDVHSFEFRGQLFASLGSFLRLELWYTKGKKNPTLLEYFSQAEYAVIRAAGTGRQEMVVPIAAAILYASEIPYSALTSSSATLWWWTRRKNDSSRFGAAPRLLKEVLTQWCGLGKDGSDQDFDRISRTSRALGRVGRNTGSPYQGNSMWTLPDFHSLMFVVEKVASNLAYDESPSGEQLLFETLVSALDIPLNKTRRNHVIVAAVSSAILGASSHVTVKNEDVAKQLQTKLLKLLRNTGEIVRTSSMHDDFFLAYLLSLSRVHWLIKRLRFPKADSEDLAFAMFQLITPMTTKHQAFVEKQSLNIIKNHQEPLTQCCAALAADASISCKLAGLLHDNIVSVEANILQDAMNRHERPRVREVGYIAPAQEQVQKAACRIQKRSREHNINDSLRSSPYYEEAVIKNVRLFLWQSLPLQSLQTKYEFAIISLRILSRLRDLSGLSPSSDALLSGLTTVAFHRGCRSPLPEFTEAFSNEQEFMSDARINFTLDLVKRAALMEVLDHIEQVLPSVLPKLSNFIFQGPPFGNRAIDTSQAILVLPLKESSTKIVTEFWTSLLKGDTGGLVLNRILDPLLQGKCSERLVLNCVQSLAEFVLNDRGRLDMQSKNNSAVTRRAGHATERWKGRGLEGTLIRCLIVCDTAVLPQIAHEVEQVALRGTRDLHQDLTSLAVEAAEVSDLVRRTWLAEWSLRFAKRFDITLHIRTSRARL